MAAGEVVRGFALDTPFTQRMALGHRIRLGHALVGYYVATEDEGIVRLVRTCCGEADA